MSQEDNDDLPQIVAVRAPTHEYNQAKSTEIDFHSLMYYSEQGK